MSLTGKDMKRRVWLLRNGSRVERGGGEVKRGAFPGLHLFIVSLSYRSGNWDVPRVV